MRCQPPNDEWSLPNRRGDFAHPAHSARAPAGGRWTEYNGLMPTDNGVTATDKRLMSADKRLLSVDNG